MSLELAAFSFVSLFGLVSLVLMMHAKNMMHAAVWLALFFSSTSLVFALMGAVLLAIIQFLVFVGGIAVMVIMAIMLGGGKLEKERNDPKTFLVSALFLAAILSYLPPGGVVPTYGLGSLSAAFSQFGFLAVVSGLILFSSLVAAVYLLRRG